MLVHANTYEGTPARLYRTAREVEMDISYIRGRAAEIENMLSVRNLIMEIITDYADKNPEQWVPELESAVCEARAALDTLQGLNSRLGELREELGDIRCMMRR